MDGGPAGAEAAGERVSRCQGRGGEGGGGFGGEVGGEEVSWMLTSVVTTKGGVLER